MIEALDLQVGRVVEAIHATGLTDNTIIVFTSDSGGERFADTWPFTGRKTELLEGGLRILAILSWPARIPQSRNTDQVAISMDWLVAQPANAADRMQLVAMMYRPAGSTNLSST